MSQASFQVFFGGVAKLLLQPWNTVFNPKVSFKLGKFLLQPQGFLATLQVFFGQGAWPKKNVLIIFNVTRVLCTEAQPVEALGHILR